MIKDEFLVSNDLQPRIEEIRYPDEQIDKEFLSDILSSTKGDIYIVSGEANYKVYNGLEECIEETLDCGATLHFITGPIVSIPDDLGKSLKQEDRQDKNALIRLALRSASSYNNVLVYQSEKRQPYHYRVFAEKNTTMAFEIHELFSRAPTLWIWYNSENEKRARIRDFKKIIKSKSPIKDSFYKHFLFLTDSEIVSLREWIKRRNISPFTISFKECEEFWKQKEEKG